MDVLSYMGLQIYDRKIKDEGNSKNVVLLECSQT